jgi:uncharacterized membrane protein YozB (DUF420 family)
VATIPLSSDTERGEARFFFTMACVMAATIVGGFLFNILTGRSSFAVPLVVHLHALVMMGWVGLYLTQNFLVFSDNIALHRRLGWLSVLFVPAILAMGVAITSWTMRTRGGPPFFDQNQFLCSNPLQLSGMAALVAWAVTVRRNTGWHRRLMFSAFAMLLGPGMGRLLPAPYLIPYAWYLTAILPAVLFPAIGMLADKKRYGAVHPAWLWGVGTVLGLQVIADLYAYSDAGIVFTQAFVAGTPGAERPMEAFFPPM